MQTEALLRETREGDRSCTQLVEFILHLSRSLPNATEAINKDLLAQFEAQVKTEDPNAEIPEENRREVVKALVAKVAELRGAMEGLKDAGE